jgi:hypothetical protein
VRVSSGRLVVERAKETAASLDIDGSTLRTLAAAAGADLDAPFEAGHDTPPLGDVDGGASRIQLWPEHFDAGCDVEAGADRCNLGASPGDGFSAQPYLYVGPWSADRPGDPGFWDAPFGATLPLADLTSVAVGVQFLVRGVRLLRSA